MVKTATVAALLTHESRAMKQRRCSLEFWAGCTTFSTSRWAVPRCIVPQQQCHNNHHRRRVECMMLSGSRRLCAVDLALYSYDSALCLVLYTGHLIRNRDTVPYLVLVLG